MVTVVITKKQYNQSFGDGLTAQIDTFQVFILAFYAYAFKTGKIVINDLEKVIKYSIIINLIILVLFRDYVSVSTTSSGHSVTFKSNFLPKEFVRLGVMYYYAAFLKRGKYIDLFIASFLLFFPNVLIHFERGYFAVAFLLMGLTMFFARKSKKAVMNFIISIFVATMSLIMLISFVGDIGGAQIQRYSDIISGISGTHVSDPSVTYRLKEIAAGAKLYTNDPILGSGKIKQVNSQLIVGIDFYPTDIGVIGMLDTYGIVGLVVFIIMFIISGILYVKILKRVNRYSIFTIGIATYVFAICINSIQTGVIINQPAYWAFLYMVCLYSKNTDDKNYQMLLPDEDDEADHENNELNTGTLLIE